MQHLRVVYSINIRVCLSTKYRCGQVVKGVGDLDQIWPWSCLKLRCAEGREFDPLLGQYSRMSFSSDPGDWYRTVSSSEHAFPSKFWIYLEHCPRGEAVIIGHLRVSSMM